MKKYRFEVLIFIINAVYMILELIASRILSPYFGSSNMVWTSVIGIILLSSSIGNFLGGIIADKNDYPNIKKVLKILLILITFTILLIPILEQSLLVLITYFITNIKLGAIISTILLFFIPSMLIGIITPNIIKLKLESIDKVGKTTGSISAISTLGGIFGTFLGGFWLVPNIGSKQLLYGLAIVVILLIYIIEEIKFNKKNNIIYFLSLICIISIIFTMINSIKVNASNGKAVLNGEFNTFVEYDTEYGKVLIYNVENNGKPYRMLEIDNGSESGSYINEDKYELVFEYTKYYDLMFKSPNKIDNVLMIGGAGNSYPKYYISHYSDKKMDVVEIDEKVIELSKKYFFVDDLINEYGQERINFIADDGRTYLNKNTKKYDAILNDAFAGGTPAATLTTKEAVEKIYNSLNENGLYLTNIISATQGEDSKFIKAEINTLKQFFKNVYTIPCNYELYLQDKTKADNIMVIATDIELNIDGAVDIYIEDDEIVLTDNYCPVDNLIPRFYR
ncbi:MAG: spermidine synthase [Clostridiales bacterium]|nr:spermidine synthase [Clostridiales bacterium]